MEEKFESAKNQDIYPSLKNLRTHHFNHKYLIRKEKQSFSEKIMEILNYILKKVLDNEYYYLIKYS